MNFDMSIYEYAFLINKQISENVLSCYGVILTHSGIADTQTHSLDSMAVDACHVSVRYNALRKSSEYVGWK